ncbi:TrkA C-terminal domain-containing protein [Faecalicatena contorta]|uniref:K+/H+ antiporter YhaU, regulatory subunit KhtT n=1 Tax=Faecalicatena contorta TaxID=39482 RepID=A0A316A189_9FIRM|nr:TrkA C-terminal domain-containing protein [Faecalicatena contorta]PWJ50474.1 K+/H+ antiporter YhaU regulatory subunit KhtT [Faecalicatena contorta]SUQ13882.1 K+/H+ antiporter YhaU, regulatory subunit KhtT [Faecalicatena contorta]
MEKSNTAKTVVLPVYQRIAADIAAKIVEKKYVVGEKIYSRSSIASQYSVSAETARRAICILSDLEIVSTTKGSGVTILSYEKAAQFLQRFHNTQTISNLKKELLERISEQKKELDALGEQVVSLVEKSERFQEIHPFTPFEIKVPEGKDCIGKTLSNLNFWQSTAATVIAIQREETLLISPGPYVSLSEGDLLYFIGDETSFERVQDFLLTYKATHEATFE